MHEMSIAASIVELVEEHAARDGFRRARTVRLAIGALSHVEPRSLEFGWDVVTRGTVAEGARLAIERPAGMGYCTDCSKNVPIAALGDSCPECQGNKWMLVEGDELRVIDLEVD